MKKIALSAVRRLLKIIRLKFTGAMIAEFR